MAEPQVFLSRHDDMAEALGEAEANELMRELELRESAKRGHIEYVESHMRRGRWLPAGDLDAMIAEVQDEAAEEISRLQAEVEQVQNALEQTEYARLLRQLTELREELDQARRTCTTRQDRLVRYMYESQRLAEHAKRTGRTFDEVVAEAQKFNAGGGF